jgi:membrane protease YdiL (CAAX protease family)
MSESEPNPNPRDVAATYVPGIAQSLALCLLFFTIFFAVTIAFQVLRGFTGVSLSMFSSILVTQVIAWPITLWVGLRWSGAPFREACPLTPFPVRIVPALLIANSGATILLLAAAMLIPMPEAIQKYLTEGVAGSSKIPFFFALVVAAPIAEELFFRGLVLRGYCGRYSTKKAVWASAIFFAFFHLDPWQAVMALPLGLAFAWLFLRTGSLLPSILSHATVNFFRNFLLSPLARGLGYDDKALKALGHLPVSVLAIGAAMAGVGGFILWKQVTGFSTQRIAS